MIGAYLSGHGAGNRFKEELMGWLVSRMDEGQMLVDLAKKIKIAVANTFLPDEAETLANT